MKLINIKDRPVTNWEELLEQLHSQTVIPQWPKQGNHFRSPYVFRGMSDSEWPLETSLERLKSPPDAVEAPMLRSFRKYAPRGTFSRHSDWEALAVAQHNGLPTRLLDWSVSPLIAVHFATDERQYFGCDGAVWCVDVVALRDEVLPDAIAGTIKDKKHRASVFDVTLLEQAFPRLANFDATRDVDGPACIFFEPPSIDARIANQTGILSAMNGPAESHHQYFEHVAGKHKDAVFRVVIDKKAKSVIRDMLDQNNIHERMLFPGLPGLCTWLKRYYGPA